MLIDFIKRKVWAVVHVGVYFASKFVKRNENVWVFGAWKGKLFSDNTKYMYLYMRENHPEIRSVWITKEKKIVDQMREKGLECYYFNSWDGIKASLKAKAAFTTAGMGDIAEWASSGAQHVALWHGTPLKKIWYDNTGWNEVLKVSKIQKIKNIFLPYLKRDDKDDIYIVSSNEAKSKFETAFRADPESIFVVGQPRNDAFVNKPRNKYFEKLRGENPKKKIVCYMPTHRNFGTVNNNPLNVDILLETDKFLAKHNLILILKPHFHEMKHYIHMTGEFQNIILGIDQETFSDPYCFLPYCDLLISDYSSIYADYLCSGNPIVLFPYDLEQYISSDAGLYYDYESIAPGPICYMWDEVLKSVVEEMKKETVSDQYERVYKLFNVFNDGKNCERTYEVVRRVLDEKATKSGD